MDLSYLIKHQILKIFSLHNVRRIWPFLTAQHLIQALVISRLAYCISLLARVSLFAISRLQTIQNSACLVHNLPMFFHVTLPLRSLHWLPIAARIKLMTIFAFQVSNVYTPHYQRPQTPPLQNYTPAHRLMSSTSRCRTCPYLRSKYVRNVSSGFYIHLHRTSLCLCVFHDGLKKWLLTQQQG